MVGAVDAKSEGGGAAADDCFPEIDLLGSEDIAFMADVDESMIFDSLLLRQRRIQSSTPDEFKTPMLPF